MCFFFFFSSRRRHTRSLCDWSSDVCSSDLERQAQRRLHRRGGHGPQRRARHGRREHLRAVRRGLEERRRRVPDLHQGKRSEERRVGKECRSRWTTKDKKKKK